MGKNILLLQDSGKYFIFVRMTEFIKTEILKCAQHYKDVLSLPKNFKQNVIIQKLFKEGFREIPVNVKTLMYKKISTSNINLTNLQTYDDIVCFAIVEKCGDEEIVSDCKENGLILSISPNNEVLFEVEVYSGDVETFKLPIEKLKKLQFEPEEPEQDMRCL